MKFSKRKVTKVFITVFLITFVILLYQGFYWNIIPQKSYNAEELDIKMLKSTADYDKDGIDDYTDIMLGARAYTETKPKYKSSYHQGGYPPKGTGVCTDVIWAAFKNAGYDLKNLVDCDIANNLSEYTTINIPDPNIDFRRVKNLRIFFQRDAEALTLDPKAVDEWQPGDIVVYQKHIAVISDKRDRKGQPYIIHHAGQPVLEEDALTRYKIIGHYRYNQE